MCELKVYERFLIDNIEKDEIFNGPEILSKRPRGVSDSFPQSAARNQTGPAKPAN